MVGNTIDERPTVLVVDDDRDTADLVTKYIADDYDVETVYSGEAALDIVDSSVDVVLLDRLMPDVSGDEVLETIRERGIDCRVVMITAVEASLEIIDLPFDDYLVKPVTRAVVHDAVERMVIRDAYDESIQEIVAVASKMATLESKLPIHKLKANDEYAALEDHLSELREDARMDGSEEGPYPEFVIEKIRMSLS